MQVNAPEALDMNALERDNKQTESSCAICQNTCNSKSFYKLDCGHSFHSNCLIEAFRRDPRCPLCRDRTGVNRSSSYLTMEALFKIKKKLSKRKDAPKELKRLVRMWDKKEQRIKLRKQEHVQWKKSEEGKEYARLRKIDQRYWYRAGLHNFYGRGDRTIERQIALYPVLPLTIRVKKRN